MASKIKTDNTFVLGIKNGRVTFIKTFDYTTEKVAAQLYLKHVQDKSLFDSWNIGHVGQWIMEHKNDSGDTYPISVPMT